MALFSQEDVVGVFRGFREGGLEFHADLVLPYRSDFQRIPMHGQFLLVQLESADEAVLGRIASLSAEGKLAQGAGEEFNIRAVRDNRPVPEDLREQYLKYKVNIRVLGVLRQDPELTFVPSHRRLPHVGSPVAFPGDAVLREISGHNADGAELGFLALGEYIYAAGRDDLEVESWMQVSSPSVVIKFPISSIVSRRSFIFARAGFGKSNLNKLLFSSLYSDTPTIEKRGGRRVPVGTVLFDPDGEYFWPDDKGRPGLCDVPELRDRLVVFTERKAPSGYYGSFVAGGIKLDIRRLRPSDVLAIALSPERQEQQNVAKLRALNQGKWEELVNLIDENGLDTPLEDVARIVGLDARNQQAETLAARGNMTQVVRSLHSKSSQLMDMLVQALGDGKLCVVDVSQMAGRQAFILSGLILRHIFDRNQREFTNAEPKSIPTIAVIEEAQAVLNDKGSANDAYLAWVKEGRKYDLGAVLITQQPGSIPVDILSQGDNWFIFHLLSAADLVNVKRANAHFSDDLLSSLLNEPIPGQGVFWSSVGGKPYPLPIRALSFETLHPLVDPEYDQPECQVYANSLRDRFRQRAATVIRATSDAGPDLVTGTQGLPAPLPGRPTNGQDHLSEGTGPDLLDAVERQAISSIGANTQLRGKLEGKGAAWGEIKALILEVVPETFEDRDEIAYHLVPKVLNAVCGGQQQEGWHTFKNPGTGKTWVKKGPR